jgi:hypothetical protein
MNDLLPGDGQGARWQRLEAAFRETCEAVRLPARCARPSASTPSSSSAASARPPTSSRRRCTPSKTAAAGASRCAPRAPPRPCAPPSSTRCSPARPSPAGATSGRCFARRSPPRGATGSSSRWARGLRRPSPAADAEVIDLAAGFLQGLGITQFAVRLNSLGGADPRQRYRDALVAHFAPTRAELSPESQRAARAQPPAHPRLQRPARPPLQGRRPRVARRLTDDDRAHFDRVRAFLDALGLALRGRPDAMVRGLDYYTRTVFETSTPPAPSARRTPSAAAGATTALHRARRPTPVPAFGFGLGIERLLLAAPAPAPAKPFRVAVVAASKDEHAVHVGGARASRRSCAARVETQVDTRFGSMKSQMGRANDLGATGGAGPRLQRAGVGAGARHEADGDRRAALRRPRVAPRRAGAPQRAAAATEPHDATMRSVSSAADSPCALAGLSTRRPRADHARSPPTPAPAGAESPPQSPLPQSPPRTAPHGGRCRGGHPGGHPGAAAVQAVPRSPRRRRPPSASPGRRPFVARPGGTCTAPWCRPSSSWSAAPTAARRWCSRSSSASAAGQDVSLLVPPYYQYRSPTRAPTSVFPLYFRWRGLLDDGGDFATRHHPPVYYAHRWEGPARAPRLGLRRRAALLLRRLLRPHRRARPRAPGHPPAAHGAHVAARARASPSRALLLRPAARDTDWGVAPLFFAGNDLTSNYLLIPPLLTYPHREPRLRAATSPSSGPSGPATPRQRLVQPRADLLPPARPHVERAPRSSRSFTRLGAPTSAPSSRRSSTTTAAAQDSTLVTPALPEPPRRHQLGRRAADLLLVARAGHRRAHRGGPPALLPPPPPRPRAPGGCCRRSIPLRARGQRLVLNIYPLTFTGRSGPRSHTLFAPLFFDFANERDRHPLHHGHAALLALRHARVGAPCSRATSSGWSRSARASAPIEWHLLPLFSYARPRPEDVSWNVLFGLVGLPPLGHAPPAPALLGAHRPRLEIDRYERCTEGVGARDSRLSA